MTSAPAHHHALTIYLNDHLAAMTGTVELAKRAAGAETASTLGPQATVMERLRRQAATTALGGPI